MNNLNVWAVSVSAVESQNRMKIVYEERKRSTFQSIAEWVAHLFVDQTKWLIIINSTDVQSIENCVRLGLSRAVDFPFRCLIFMNKRCRRLGPNRTGKHNSFEELLMPAVVYAVIDHSRLWPDQPDPFDSRMQDIVTLSHNDGFFFSAQNSQSSKASDLWLGHQCRARHFINRLYERPLCLAANVVVWTVLFSLLLSSSLEDYNKQEWATHMNLMFVDQSDCYDDNPKIKTKRPTSSLCFSIERWVCDWRLAVDCGTSMRWRIFSASVLSELTDRLGKHTYIQTHTHTRTRTHTTINLWDWLREGADWELLNSNC